MKIIYTIYEVLQHRAYYDYETNRDVGEDCTQFREVKSFDSLKDAEQWLSGITDAYENLESVRRNLRAYTTSRTRKSPIVSEVLGNLLTIEDTTSKEYYNKYGNYVPDYCGNYQIHKEYSL